MNEWDSIVGSTRSYGSSYGSCVHSAQKLNTHYTRHDIEDGETVEGIALKYGLTPTELRRINKLYSSDSLFQRKFLLIPDSQPSTSITPKQSSVHMNGNSSDVNHSTNMPSKKSDSTESPKSTDSIEHKNDLTKKTEKNDALSFLLKLDSQISAGKKAFKDLKVEVPEEMPTSPGTAKFTKLTTKNFHKNHPKTMFSHSNSEDTEHLFQL